LNLKRFEIGFKMGLKKKRKKRKKNKTSQPSLPFPTPAQPAHPFLLFSARSRAGRRPSLSLTCALAAHRTTQATKQNRRPSISLFPFYFSFSR
jgi:hypothetical protein